eukprot:m.231078 g.231078  ORF g.231078 m.231078 type:complete len:706 (+) comp33596_c4_seq4:223-2340(+)
MEVSSYLAHRNFALVVVGLFVMIFLLFFNPHDHELDAKISALAPVLENKQINKITNIVKTEDGTPAALTYKKHKFEAGHIHDTVVNRFSITQAPKTSMHTSLAFGVICRGSMLSSEEEAVKYRKVLQHWSDAGAAVGVNVSFIIATDSFCKHDVLAQTNLTIVFLEEVKGMIVNYPGRIYASLKLWSYVANLDVNDQFDWVMKLDMETYVNMGVLLKMLPTLPTNEPLYTGQITHAHSELEETFPTETYCSGFAYLMNKKAYTVFNKPYDTLKKNYNNKIVTMQKFINRLNSDIPRARYPMDDTVIAHELHNSGDIRCTANSGFVFLPYAVDGEGALESTYQWGIPSSNTNGLTPIMQLPSYVHKASIIAPFKKSSQLYAVHEMLMLQLRPAIPVAKWVKDTTNGLDRYKFGINRWNSRMNESCVANFAHNFVHYNVHLPTCEYTFASKSPKLELKKAITFTLNITKTKAKTQHRYDGAAAEVVYTQAVNGIAAIKHPVFGAFLRTRAIRAGALGYRLSVTHILEEADTYTDEDFIWIVDDDVIFHKNYKSMLASLDTHCLSPILSKDGFGVLLLGASMQYKGSFPKVHHQEAYTGGWNIAQFEMKEHKSVCFSGHQAVLGSFSMVIHKAVIPHMLNWMRENPDLPFDWIWVYLADVGFPVRITYPHLNLADIKKQSSIDKRITTSESILKEATMKKWELEDYIY